MFPAQERLVNRVSDWLAYPGQPIMTQDIPELGAAIGSTVGQVRGENQDRAVIVRFVRSAGIQTVAKPELLFTVCDGMGGMSNGARCAEIAVAYLIGSLVYSQSDSLNTRLSNAVHTANDEVFASFKGRGGTTIAAVLLSQGEAAAVTVGDSRIYTLEGHERIRQISTDDTIAGEVSRAKGVDASDLRLGHFGSGLAQFVGMGEGIEPRFYQLEQVSDRLDFFLTSDGAHSIASTVLERVVATAPNPQTCVTRILHLSRWCGGLDNATVVTGTLTAPKIPAEMTGVAARTPSAFELWDSHSKLELWFEGTTDTRAAVLSSVPPSKAPTTFSPVTKQRSPVNATKDAKKRRKRERAGRSAKESRSESQGQTRLEIEIKAGGDPAVPPTETAKPPERSPSSIATDQSTSPQPAPADKNDLKPPVDRNGSI